MERAFGEGPRRRAARAGCRGSAASTSEITRVRSRPVDPRRAVLPAACAGWAQCGSSADKPRRLCSLQANENRERLLQPYA